MKIDSSSKRASIRFESELVDHFCALLPKDPDLRWHFTTDRKQGRLKILQLELDDRRQSFLPVYELKPTLPGLKEAGASLKENSLLVTPELSDRVLEGCKRLNLSAIDLNGRAWLRAPGLLVSRDALPGRHFRHELEPRNMFVGKSARIIRCLLTDHGRIWTQSEIVVRTQASSGLVSRIVQHLVSQGFVKKVSPREFRVAEHQMLLNAWVDSDRFAKRNRTTMYAGWIGSPIELARELQDWAHKENIPLAFTQWIGAWVRRPFTEPAITSAYLKRAPGPTALQRLGLRPVNEGGKLWLHVPDDEGLFTETQSVAGLTLTTDAQIVLDLQRTGLRGPDAADALREWEGFCRP